jgi:hypothetical protein
MILLLLALSTLAAGMPARACSVCGCGDPLVAAAEGHGRGGDLRVAVEGEYLSQKAGTEGEPGMTDVLDQYTLRLTGVYSPVAALNLVATIPFLRKKMAMDGTGGALLPVSDVTTLGDVELGARYFSGSTPASRSPSTRAWWGSSRSVRPSSPASSTKRSDGRPRTERRQVRPAWWSAALELHDLRREQGQRRGGGRAPALNSAKALV